MARHRAYGGPLGKGFYRRVPWRNNSIGDGKACAQAAVAQHQHLSVPRVASEIARACCDGIVARVSQGGQSCYGLRSKTEAKRRRVVRHLRLLQARVVVVACMDGALDLGSVVWHIVSMLWRRVKKLAISVSVGRNDDHMASCSMGDESSEGASACQGES